jgi:hypothetical protein
MSRVDFDRRVCSPSGADEPAAWGSKGYGITLPSLWSLLRRMSFRRCALLERPPSRSPSSAAASLPPTTSFWPRGCTAG